MFLRKTDILSLMQKLHRLSHIPARRGLRFDDTAKLEASRVIRNYGPRIPHYQPCFTKNRVDLPDFGKSLSNRPFMWFFLY